MDEKIGFEIFNKLPIELRCEIIKIIENDPRRLHEENFTYCLRELIELRHYIEDSLNISFVPQNIKIVQMFIFRGFF